MHKTGRVVLLVLALFPKLKQKNRKTCGLAFSIQDMEINGKNYSALEIFFPE